MRELLRYRRSLIDERAREVNRLQKVLEGANIKLASIASDILGKSSRAMLEALIRGEEDPEILSNLALRRLKRKKEVLKRALNGRVGTHQKMMLATQLRHIDFMDAEIERLDQTVKERMLPFEAHLERIDTIPGVGLRTAEQVLAETGIDVVRQFGSAPRLCSWAGVVPGHHESAGKRKSGRTRHGNKKLRSALVEAAHAAARTKGTYLSSMYHRIAARRGAKRAALAVAHAILTIIYHLIAREQTYVELGPTYYEEKRRERVINQSIKKLEALGLKVSVEATA